MEAESAAVSFEQLPLARPDMPPMPVGMYRVYKDKKIFSIVQAASALEALENSGFGHAIKIEREDMMSNNLLNPKFWESDAPAPIVGAQPAESAPAASEVQPAEAASAPSGDAPLSNNDVDKLLNG